MKRGFTIIELLVVMAIIGMLASIILVVFSGIQAKSRDTRRMQDVRELQKALSLYYVNTNRFPEAVTAVAVDGTDPIITALVAEGVLPSFAGDPVTPNFDYFYRSSGVASYTITFCLETDSIPNYTQGCSNTIQP